MEEKIEISILLSLYGNLLTETQKNYMELYYNQDYSLSEIAENENITRQAVRTNLLKSKKKLKNYEKRLGLMEKDKKIKEMIENLENTKLDKKQKEIITEMKEQLNF